MNDQWLYSHVVKSKEFPSWSEGSNATQRNNCSTKVKSSFCLCSG